MEEYKDGKKKEWPEKYDPPMMKPWKEVDEEMVRNDSLDGVRSINDDAGCNGIKHQAAQNPNIAFLHHSYNSNFLSWF